MSALTTHRFWKSKRKGKEIERLKETPTSDRKPKERQRARSLEEEKSQTP
jgi:hypothetical protein